MKRRDFLKLSGCFVAAAKIGVLPACGGDSGEPTGVFAFPQGLASGDPRATSVMLWTRVETVAGGTEPVALTVQVSESESFDTVVVEQAAEATTDSDHTVRVLVTGLTAGTTYYYRFVAGGDSIVGRTMTAPADDSDDEVRLAWVSCQDYVAGTYGAWRQMINDDRAAPAGEQIQVILQLGDFIYETVGSSFQTAIDENHEPVDLKNADGTPRSIEPFPDGGVDPQDSSRTFALTLNDYRHLYKQYLRDPHLRAARARWPFIQTWDDHEFTDDCWQSQANYDDANSSDEASQPRKVAANQAWFEYIPANLSNAEGVPGVANEASDFVPTEVENVAFGEVDDNNLAIEANNVAALASMTIYRSVRYGKHIDFVVTDQRSYRSDHTIPEEQTYEQALFFHPRTFLPSEMIRVLDAGRTANGGNPPDQVEGLANTRKDSAPGTMLGGPQKAWWKETMQKSTATWKIWCNEVPMMRFDVPKGPAGILIADRVAWCEAWDDKPTERNELMTFLKDNDIDNVVVVTGDMHAHFAGTLMHNYDVDTPEPVAAEFVAAGITSNTIFSFVENAVRGQPPTLIDLIHFDATQFGGTKKLEVNLNTTLLYGTGAAIAAAQTGSAADALAARDETVNPHLKFVHSNAQGYGLMTVTPTGVETTLVTIERPLTDKGDAGQGILGTATFTLAKDSRGDVQGPVLTGDKPFPLT